jgi:hypothetical protein
LCRGGGTANLHDRLRSALLSGCVHGWRLLADQSAMRSGKISEVKVVSVHSVESVSSEVVPVHTVESVSSEVVPVHTVESVSLEVVLLIHKDMLLHC